MNVFFSPPRGDAAKRQRGIPFPRLIFLGRCRKAAKGFSSPGVI